MIPPFNILCVSCLVVSVLSNSMDCSPPGSSVYGILQIRMLEWVAILFSRGSSWPRGWAQVSSIAGRFLTIWATREAPLTFLALCFQKRMQSDHMLYSLYPLLLVFKFNIFWIICYVIKYYFWTIFCWLLKILYFESPKSIYLGPYF